jgi:hypothetical protein
MKRSFLLVGLLLLLAGLLACGLSQPPPVATQAPPQAPTWTPEPTWTPPLPAPENPTPPVATLVPTWTPSPAATPVAEVTTTPTPSPTLTPTYPPGKDCPGGCGYACFPPMPSAWTVTIQGGVKTPDNAPFVGAEVCFCAEEAGGDCARWECAPTSSAPDKPGIYEVTYTTTKCQIPTRYKVTAPNWPTLEAPMPAFGGDCMSEAIGLQMPPITMVMALPPAAASYVVTGTVVDAIFGKPLPGVVVACTAMGEIGQATTDSQGHYRIEGTAHAGRNVVCEAKKDSFASQVNESSRSGQQHMVDFVLVPAIAQPEAKVAFAAGQLNLGQPVTPLKTGNVCWLPACLAQGQGLLWMEDRTVAVLGGGSYMFTAENWEAGSFSCPGIGHSCACPQRGIGQAYSQLPTDWKVALGGGGDWQERCEADSVTAVYPNGDRLILLSWLNTIVYLSPRVPADGVWSKGTWARYVLNP